MRLKRLILLVMAMVLAVPSMFSALPDKMYVQSINGGADMDAWKGATADLENPYVYLTLNSATNCYEGDIVMQLYATGDYNWTRFFAVNGEEVTYYGATYYDNTIGDQNNVPFGSGTATTPVTRANLGNKGAGTSSKPWGAYKLSALPSGDKFALVNVSIPADMATIDTGKGSITFTCKAVGATDTWLATLPQEAPAGGDDVDNDAPKIFVQPINGGADMDAWKGATADLENPYVYLTLNSATNCYEGDIVMQLYATGDYNWTRFFAVNGEEVTYYGATYYDNTIGDQNNVPFGSGTATTPVTRANLGNKGAGTSSKPWGAYKLSALPSGDKFALVSVSIPNNMATIDTGKGSITFTCKAVGATDTWSATLPTAVPGGNGGGNGGGDVPSGDYSVTFNFKGYGSLESESDLTKYVTLTSLSTAENLEVTNPYQYFYDSFMESAINFAAAEGYVFSFECVETGTEEDTADPQRWNVQRTSAMANDELPDAASAIQVAFQPEANGLVFDITVAKIDEAPVQVPDLFVAYGKNGDNWTSASATATDAALKYNPETGCYEGTISLGQKQIVSFYTGTPGDPVLWYGSNKIINFTNGSSVQLALGAGALGYYYTTLPTGYTSPMTLEVSVNLEAKNVIFSLPGAGNPEAFYLWKYEGSYQYVSTLNPTEAGGAVYETKVEVGANFGMFLCTSQSNFSTATMIGQNAETTVDFTLNPGESGTVNMILGSSKKTIITNAGTYTITYDYKANTVTVTREASDAPAQGDVTFNFTGNVANPYQYVTLFDMNRATPIELTGDTYEYMFDDEPPYRLTAGLTEAATEAGYKLTITGEGTPSSGTYIVQAGGPGQFTIALFDAYKGKSLTFEVTKTAEGPSIVFNFEGEPNAEQYISFANAITMETVPVDSNPFSYYYEIDSDEGMAIVFIGIKKEYQEQGYNLSLTGPNGETDGGGVQGQYQFMTAALNGDTGYRIFILPGFVSGTEFTANVTGQKEPMYVATGASAAGIAVSQEDIALEWNAATSTYDGEITLALDEYFKFYLTDGGTTTYYGGSGGIGATNQGLNLSFNQNPTLNLYSNTNIANAGSFYVATISGNGMKQVTLSISVNLATKKVTFKQIAASADDPSGSDKYPAELKVAKGSSQAAIAPAADDVVLSYNAANETYEGEINLPIYTLGYVYFNFYGAIDEVISFYGCANTTSTSYTTGTLQFATNTTQTSPIWTAAQASQAGSWYLRSLSGTGNLNATIGITVSLKDNSVTFTEKSVSNVPQTLYMEGNTDGGTAIKINEAIVASNENPNLFKWTYDVPEGGMYVFFGAVPNKINSNPRYQPSEAVDIEGEYSAKWNVVTTSGQPVFAHLPNAGETTFSIDFSTMQVDIVAPKSVPQCDEIRVYMIPNMGFNSYNAEVVPSDNDPVLKLNETTGEYEGELTGWQKYEGTNYHAIKLYSEIDGAYTYYGYLYNNSPSNGTLDFSKGSEYSFELPSSDVSTQVGTYYVFKYPNNATTGDVKITVNAERTSITFTYLANSSVTKEVWFMGSTEGTGKADVREKMTQSTVDKNVWEITYNVPAVKAGADDEIAGTEGFNFFFNTTGGSVGSSGNYGPQEGEENIEFVYGGPKTISQTWVETNNNGKALTPGNTKFRFNIETLKFEAEYLDEIPEPEVSDVIYAAIVTGARNSYKEAFTPANPVALVLNELTGTYEGTLTLPASTTTAYKYLKFYTGEGSDLTYYGPQANFGSGLTANAVVLNMTPGSSLNLEFAESTDVTTVGAWYSWKEIELELSVNLATGELNVSYPDNSEKPEAGAIYLAEGNGIQGPLTLTNQKLESTGNGIYSGKIAISKGTIFNFRMTAANGTVTTYAPASGMHNISFTNGTTWPDEDEENIAAARFTVNGNGSWYFASYPTDCQGNFNVTVNLNNNTVQIAPVIERAPAPAEVYLWGSNLGYQIDSRFTNRGTLTKSASDPNLYTLNDFVVPQCGPFVSDEEYGPLEGDPDYGFYFFLSTSKDSNTAGTWFQPTIENHLFEIPTAGDVYKTKTVYNKTGANFICLSPGKVNITFNYETLEFTMTMVEPETVITPSKERLYIKTREGQGAIQPSDDDQYIEEVSNGVYKGTLSIKKGLYFQFYNETTTYAPAGYANISFAEGPAWPEDSNDSDGRDEERYTVIANGTGRWYISLAYVDGDGTYDVTVNLNTMRLSLVSNKKIEEAPAQMYIWIPSDPELQRFEIAATMLPTDENPNVYVIDWNVPEVPYMVVDPKDGTPYGQYFFFSPNDKISSSMTRYLAWQGAEEGDMFNAYEFTPEVSEVELPVIKNRGSGANNFIQLTPGMTTITLDIENLKFTAKANFNLYGITLDFQDNEGIVLSNADIRKSVMVVDFSKVEDELEEGVMAITANPYQYIFTSAQGMLMFYPLNGCTIEVSCTNFDGPATDAPFQIGGVAAADEDMAGGEVESPTTLNFSNMASGLNFLVKVTPNQTDGIGNIYDFDAENGYNVFNLQGVVILRNGTAEDLKLLEPGLYIINGKKVVVRN